MGEWTGILAITAEQKQGKTIVSDVYVQGALKVTRPFYYDDSGEACFYIMNPGGGYVDGDRYKMDIQLDKDASLILTGQSATKIYKSVGRPAMQRMNMKLKAGSSLEFMADPLIAYENAQYDQRTVVHMERGATLLYTDIITPGWSPDGDSFKYKLLQLKTEIYMDDELIVYDHLRFRPEIHNLNDLGYLEGYSHFGSMFAIAEEITHDYVDKIYESLNEIVAKSDCKLGLSMLPASGFSIRVLAHSSYEIEEIFVKCQHLIRKDLLGKKAVTLRKY